MHFRFNFSFKNLTISKSDQVVKYILKALNFYRSIVVTHSKIIHTKIIVILLTYQEYHYYWCLMYHSEKCVKVLSTYLPIYKML